MSEHADLPRLIERPALVARLINRREVHRPADVMPYPDRVTESCVRRAMAHDKVPAYMRPFIADVLAYTLSNYAGIRRLKGGNGRAYVFAFEGERHDGVYCGLKPERAQEVSAFEHPWPCGLGAPEPLWTAALDRGWKWTTAATKLGGVMEALHRGSLASTYERTETREARSREQHDLFSSPSPDGRVEGRRGGRSR